MKPIFVSILCMVYLFTASKYHGGSLAPVSVAGGVIKAKHNDSVEKKYKRSECPVCKGKGWYLSGDKIKKVECGYCEPDQEDSHKPSPTIIKRK